MKIQSKGREPLPRELQKMSSKHYLGEMFAGFDSLISKM
jgi:hypothetical protein